MSPRRRRPVRDLRARPRATRVGTLEAQLMASAGGDAVAFASLYERAAPRIYGLVLRILRDARESEEVTARVFLEIWQTSSCFDPTLGSAHAWLTTIAHRSAVQRVRQTRYRGDTVSVEGTDRAAQGGAASPAHSTLDARVIPAGLELAYYGGHTYQEVSQLLNVSLQTATSHIRDGLILLREDPRRVS